MNMDRNNRNCYNCERFGHLARNCRNSGMRNRIGEDRRLEYGNKNNRQRRSEEGNEQNNLNGKQDLILLN